MGKRIGVLTSGGDCPGLNAAIRALGKSAERQHKMKVTGFIDGFRGLIYDQSVPLEAAQLHDLLTRGGTILGTSRDKPHKMEVDGKVVDMSKNALATYKAHKLDCLVCIGGGGTIKNAAQLQKLGMNIVAMPKTIDNDLEGTDTSFGFDTALQIATEAIDRLHSTAHSHHRIIVVEVMGHNAGWLALGAGLAGGADVILIPEIPFDIEIAAQAINYRKELGKNFSIVVVAEGAVSRKTQDEIQLLAKKLASANPEGKELKELKAKLRESKSAAMGQTALIASELERLTGLESRLTILGHIQRGGTPTAFDRLIATKIGAATADCIARGEYGVMLAVQGDSAVAVPLEKIVGKKKLVSVDHPWVKAARAIDTSFGDR
jgi:6-phosphofructokinase 1